MKSIPALFLLAFVLPEIQAAPQDQRWESEILPIVVNNCYDCHGDGVKKGGLDFDAFQGVDDMIADRERWKRIRGHLEQHLMPPPDEFQPSDEERKKIIQWIDEAIFPVDPNKPDPGRVTLRRLNRLEYQNTIADLLGVNIKVEDLLPPDDSGYGFDNIGDVLTLSPVHMERFLEAARISLDKAVKIEPMPYPNRRIAAEDLEGPGQSNADGHYLTQNGAAGLTHHFKKPGTYLIAVTAGGEKGGEEWPNMQLSVDGEVKAEWEVDASYAEPIRYEKKIAIRKEGSVDVAAVFTNDFWDPDLKHDRDRNLLVQSIYIEGPLEGPRLPKPETHRNIFGDRAVGVSDEAWALEVFQLFARRAFRRPCEPGEAERYLYFVRLAKEQNQSVEQGIRHGLEAMLVSPSFLFREEPQPEPDNAERIHQINEHALASRLSYFLWSTMPDERLMRLASDGKLREQLDNEIERMLDSPKSKRMVENFTGQWLQLRDLHSKQPSNKVFPNFRHTIKHAFGEETERLFQHLLQQNRPLSEMLNADYTFVNETLAKHYGIQGVKGDEFRKVSLVGTPRRGLLGHGAFHVITSHPTRTSPVLRGKFVLENILDQAPPPPPPNVAQLAPPDDKTKDMSLREQMELHRSSPDCSSCHALMDPIGFGLENFNADGTFRDMENGQAIDASGKLVSGREFNGADELLQILIQHHRSEFHRAVASKMLTYAIGRGVDWYDKPALDQIVRNTEAAGGGVRDLIHAIIQSVPFQKRRGEG